ncbi:MAG: hypothetical protein GY854_24380 [Deltaproteobacteria bacterium]|nr:hypothetical protein [Deltaproteobacteria bacterium]
MSAHRKSARHVTNSGWRQFIIGVLAFPWIIVVLAGVGYRLTMPGALFLLRFMDKGSEGDPLSVREVVIEQGSRRISARVYQPMGDHDRVLVVVHGVHFGGYDEPRLVHFSKRLAGLGHAVITPDIQDLKNYSIEVQALDDIERVTKWALDDSGLVDPSGGGRVGLLGISFAGGLCVSAAGSKDLEDRLDFVFSFGGHADLDRTMKYLVTGDLPDGGKLPPHIYGQAVILSRFAHQLVPSKDVEPLKQALNHYLREEWKTVREKAAHLSPKARRLVMLCLERKTEELGPILEPLIKTEQSLSALSPVRHDPPSCPVFLLHGSVDNVIPPSETVALERWASKSTETTALVSPLITHVELGDKVRIFSPIPYYKIIRFWTELLREEAD